MVMGTTYDFEPAAAQASTVTVTIDKMIDGSMATAATANNSAFPMTATWNATNIGAGSGNYDLDADGFNGDPTPYQAITAQMTSGADYTTSEVTGGSVVGASCADGKPFALNGYSSGDTMQAAQAAATTTQAPTLTNITSNKYILVWNKTCATVPPAATTSQVTIVKYVNGAHADTTNASSTTFPFTATYQASNVVGGNQGSDPFTIGPVGNGTPTAYEAMTIPLANGAMYNATENTGTVTGATCQDGKPFALSGYSSGDTMQAAQAATMSSTSPTFTNLQSNKYVIVWNVTCAQQPVSTVPPANACDNQSAAPQGYTLRKGTSGNDTVTLAPNTMFVGKGGNDHVTAGAGNYIVCTGNGNDSITLGNGNSTIDASGGNNDVSVGNGQGSIMTGNGNDTVVAGDGARTINVGGGNNSVMSGDGAQTITAGAGNDEIKAGGGDDTVNAGGGNNKIWGEGGADMLTAAAGNDQLDGGAGTDTCQAGGGNNTKTSCEL